MAAMSQYILRDVPEDRVRYHICSSALPIRVEAHTVATCIRQRTHMLTIVNTHLVFIGCTVISLTPSLLLHSIPIVSCVKEFLTISSLLLISLLPDPL